VLEKTHDRIKQPIVRFNTSVRGLPAELVLEWQERGLVRSKSDALRQALLALAQKFSILENELAKYRSQQVDIEDGESARR